MKLPANGRVAVLGSGVSGLAFSFFLTKLRPDVRVDIFEKSSLPGGYIKSSKLKYGHNETVLEKGPRTLRGSSIGTTVIVDMLRTLESHDIVEVIDKDSVSNTKYLLSTDRSLVEVPHSYQSFIKFLKSGVASGIFTSVVRELFNRSKLAPAEDETIESFFKRHFGSTKITDRVLSAILHGIYGGDVAKLSVRSVFPKLVEMESPSGSVIRSMIKRVREKSEPSKTIPGLAQYEAISPNEDLVSLHTRLKKFPIVRLKGGLQEFIFKMSAYLETQPQVKFHYNSEVSAIDLRHGTLTADGDIQQYDHIRSTINSNALAKIIQSQELKELLQLHYISIFICNVFTTSPKISKEHKGFGFLVPKSVQNPENLLGVIFDSDVEQHARPLFGEKVEIDQNYQKITLMIGGHYFDDIGTIPSDAINLKAAKKILQEILKFDLENHNVILENNQDIPLSSNDILISHQLIGDCIPQFNRGYEQQRTKLKLKLHEYDKFSLGGTSFGSGVGVPDCVMESLLGCLELK